MKKLMMILTVAFTFCLLGSTLKAQIDYCEGNFDYDQDQDGTDAFQFKTDFGRHQYENPCPPNGPGPVPQTGQTTSYNLGDDGEFERGVEWPNPRFTDNGDGTVKDNLTGLIWLKHANCFDQRAWEEALSDCNGLSAGWCGLTDGSSAGDWRLPNHKELYSLTDAGSDNPTLPSGHPFINVQSTNYWSSTTCVGSTVSAWYVEMGSGILGNFDKASQVYVWPVRGGQ